MRRLLLFACAIIGVTLFAAPEVSDLKVTPIEPIGLAIDYTVSGATDDGKGCYLSVSMSVDGTTYVAKSLTGATNCVNGAHRVYWNVAKDGITLGEADLDVTVNYDIPLYCVIDLTKGSSAASYPVIYLNAPPSSGFNTTEYKTTKLVLKRVDAGTFTMGDSDESDNQPHTVTLTKPFYMGLYEVTQKQWELVMGSNPCSSTSYGKGDAYPVHYVSYNDIRGSSEGAKWPTTNSVDATSFLGKLRARTGLDFDLPTEAQWEYTCRAGTTTTYSHDDSEKGNYMWYWDNSSDGTKVVGTKKANPWGFYDMHGNVWEWCLDWYNSSLSGGEDPVGSSSGSGRVERGGSWGDNASSCTSSSRDYYGPSYYDIIFGFRLSRTLP
jgi:formylglycine-generating enzyme required for sulfatase activity